MLVPADMHLRLEAVHLLATETLVLAEMHL
jgi:hypothetical protein